MPPLQGVEVCVATLPWGVGPREERVIQAIAVSIPAPSWVRIGRRKKSLRVERDIMASTNTNGEFNPFDPTGMLKEMRDANMDAWSKMMVEFVEHRGLCRVDRRDAGCLADHFRAFAQDV